MQKRPLITTMTSNGTIYAIGDLIMQAIETSKLHSKGNNINSFKTNFDFVRFIR